MGYGIPRSLENKELERKAQELAKDRINKMSNPSSNDKAIALVNARREVSNK